VLLGAPTAWSGVRRQTDYYDEAALIWLETDVLIRQRTHGARSLDHFCRSFFGSSENVPQVKTYVLEDVLAGLQEVLPYNWRDFFEQRIYQPSAPPPLGGITNGGWRLVYDSEPNRFRSARATTRKQIDWSYGLGMKINPEGKLLDVLPGAPAFVAGLNAGWKVIGVNGRKWSPEGLSQALAECSGSNRGIEFLIEQAERVKTVSVDYHGGAMFPHLERLSGTPDIVSEILAPGKPN
jgi:predicted metalloprotease with PDZ domain